ncbi:Aldo/keto reductase [Cryphonectria parasitica EP155]|uniref:Aldo/keto reductase n=1 Tax=Cryphonectria parasitica (strain ATCC 38755 / EP155) TaxID=660469 RepID=A0A9P4XWM0_CRYP1|nr:Aldo/keto reductase [Cryphonectria parasitica EP155]KAF3762191.1 Aldo/keto reductase [Cryphonectria parasitica EP155]
MSRLPPIAVAPDSPLGRHRQLSPSAAIRVSPICLGAMNFGEVSKEAMGECTKETAFSILDYFYSQGGNFIDTANAYQDGESEEWLGEWMTARDNRDEMVIATKFTGPFVGPQVNKKGIIKSNLGGNSTKSMKLSLEYSLKRLRTTYIDVFYVHWWDYTTTVEELMHSLNDLVVAGKVLYLGISDTPAWVVSKANQYARMAGLRQFSVYQGHWSAALRDMERDIIPMCLDEKMGICPYGVLGQGRFQSADVYKQREEVGEGRTIGMPISQQDRNVSAALEKIARAKGEKTTLHHVAIAYVMQKFPYVVPLLGARKLEYIEKSIPGLQVALTEADIDEIESAYPFNAGFPHTFLSGGIFQGSDVPAKGAFGSDQVVLTKMTCGYVDFVDRPKPIKPA